MLSLLNVVVHYSGIKVLKDISIDADQGVVTTLIGANGAGKTTLLKAMSSLVPLSSGEIWFMGEQIDSMRAEDVVRKGITHVPEGRGLFPYMTTYDNLLTGAFLRRDKTGIRKDLERVYEFFPVLKRKTRQLARNMSGGEQQMLAFGRGLMANPKLYLLDEPSVGLAPLLVQEVMVTVNRIALEEKIGVILVEQNAGLALSLAKKAYVLELGKVVLEGDPGKLVDDPNVKKAYLGI